MFSNNSQAEEFEDCNRKRFWSREFNGTGLQSVYRDENMDFGTIIHVGLGAFYANHAFPVMEAVDEGKKMLDFPNMYFEERNKWADHFEWIGRILNAYMPYAQENDDFVPMQIEVEGCVVLGEICYKCGDPYEVPENPEELRVCPKCRAEVNHWVFRIDMAVQKGEHKPKVNIVDHKTTNALGDVYLLSWHNSLQLWGYCYGYAKQSEMEVSGYFVNIIRKLARIGEEKSDKNCPDCRNGSRKKLTCGNCNGTGRVERELKDIQPFVREYEVWNEYKKELFVRQRVNTMDRILGERERFKHEPDAAWPMNPKACFKMGKACFFWRLCYTPHDPEKWYMPTDDQLINFVPREPDYVTIKQTAREEMD